MALKIHPMPAPKLAVTEPTVRHQIPAHLIPPPISEPIPDLSKMEMTFETVESFVRWRKRASAFELQRAFGIKYSQAVGLMDALEGREIIQPLAAYHPYQYRGPRALMN